MERREAEALLDRELDESKQRARVEVRARHRVIYAVPIVLIVAAVGSAVAYLVTTLVVQALFAPIWAYVLSALGIGAIAWGVTGIDRGRVAARDRGTDIAVSVIVASVVLGIARPTPLWHLFDRRDMSWTHEMSRGLGGVPPLWEIVTWGTVAACAFVAIASIVRAGLER
jgi:hypothetical protein